MPDQRLVEVNLVLKFTQAIEMNRWKCTINGEEREVLSRNVQYFQMDEMAALKSFKKDEVESITIKF